MNEHDLRFQLDFWLSYLMSSGVLYMVAIRLSKRWLYRLEKMLFRWVVRVVLLGVIGGGLWLLVN